MPYIYVTTYVAIATGSCVLSTYIFRCSETRVKRSLRFLTHYCKHWRGTGLQLGLKTSVLDQVEADYHTLSEHLRVTLEKWS